MHQKWLNRSSFFFWLRFFLGALMLDKFIVDLFYCHKTISHWTILWLVKMWFGIKNHTHTHYPKMFACVYYLYILWLTIKDWYILVGFAIVQTKWNLLSTHFAIIIPYTRTHTHTQFRLFSLQWQQYTLYPLCVHPSVSASFWQQVNLSSWSFSPTFS